jgi:hypothetical protein
VLGSLGDGLDAWLVWERRGSNPIALQRWKLIGRPSEETSRNGWRRSQRIELAQVGLSRNRLDRRRSDDERGENRDQGVSVSRIMGRKGVGVERSEFHRGVVRLHRGPHAGHLIGITIKLGIVKIQTQVVISYFERKLLIDISAPVKVVNVLLVVFVSNPFTLFRCHLRAGRSRVYCNVRL